MSDRRIDRLVTRHRFDDAIEQLTARNRRRPDPELERRLLQLRNEAFHELERRGSSLDWPPPHSDRFADVDGVPEIAAADLGVDAVRSGVFGRGALIVRGLFSPRQVDLLADSVDRSFTSYDRAQGDRRVDADDPWFAPFESTRDPAPPAHPRRWIREGGGVYAAESPRAMFNLMQVIGDTGIKDMVEGYFGERAALSVLKTTLRIVRPETDVSNGWHQDGAFLGSGIRSLNLWIALTACGDDAPGLKMVPRRLPEVVGPGTGAAAFSWSIDSQQIDEITDGAGPAWLRFEAGDAVFFDELNLHSTATRPGMTKSRKAIEAWFFSASHYPLDRIPLLV